MTLLEQYELANSADFINRVKMAVLTASHQLINGNASPTVKGYCQQIISNPFDEARSKVLAIGMAAAIDVATPEDVEDVFIRNAVGSVLAEYAYTYYQKNVGDDD